MKMQELNLPPDYVMSEMAKVARETATTYFAEQAEKFAQELRANKTSVISGAEALECFARTIRQMNTDLYPKPEPERPSA